MPTYSYMCKDCGHAFDVQQAFSDDALTVCPNCSGPLRKVFSAVGVVFKGSGFYRTDSRSSSGTSSSSSPSSSGTSSASSDGGSRSSTGSGGSDSSTKPSGGSSGSGSSTAPKASASSSTGAA